MWRSHVPGAMVVASMVAAMPVSPPKWDDTLDRVPPPNRLIPRTPGPMLTPFSSDAQDDDRQQAQGFGVGDVQHDGVAVQGGLDDDR